MSNCLCGIKHCDVCKLRAEFTVHYDDFSKLEACGKCVATMSAKRMTRISVLDNGGVVCSVIPGAVAVQVS